MLLTDGWWRCPGDPKSKKTSDLDRGIIEDERSYRAMVQFRALFEHSDFKERPRPSSPKTGKALIVLINRASADFLDRRSGRRER